VDEIHFRCVKDGHDTFSKGDVVRAWGDPDGFGEHFERMSDDEVAAHDGPVHVAVVSPAPAVAPTPRLD
jgi:hypothetical protein